MTTIKTIHGLTHFPESNKGDVVKFLLMKGMIQSISTPQSENQFQIV